MGKILIVFLIFLLSGFKFLAASIALMPLRLGFIPSVLLMTAGGMLGTITFTFARMALKVFMPTKPLKYKRKFTRFNKMIVFFKVKFGVFGIALLTPILLQVPVGTLIALHIESNKYKVWANILLSYFLWALVTFGIYYFITR